MAKGLYRTERREPTPPVNFYELDGAEFFALAETFEAVGIAMDAERQRMSFWVGDNEYFTRVGEA